MLICCLTSNPFLTKSNVFNLIHIYHGRLSTEDLRRAAANYENKIFHGANSQAILLYPLLADQLIRYATFTLVCLRHTYAYGVHIINMDLAFREQKGLLVCTPHVNFPLASKASIYLSQTMMPFHKVWEGYSRLIPSTIGCLRALPKIPISCLRSRLLQMYDFYRILSMGLAHH
jgi:hypothetical protein